MYLKQIDLIGFKSFADKTVLEFGKGISAVVGPNGSGKSNISDAIRWVLGEQSAKSLRGGNMQDIIFAGSDSRKAVHYADVSLTLDNSNETFPLDFSEITVTRRLHRSGESDYFINKQPCRLRDITELFMDTGIGKEAYSIIGQGRIEEILSTRSEDRRMIFEEASGIVKYKTRKNDAMRKLDETEQNIVRIHDLISELEDQIDPLEKQAEKAKKHKQLKSELIAYDISLYVYNIERVHRDWQQAGEKMKELEQEQAKWAAIVGKHDALLVSERQQVRKFEEQLEQLQTELLHVSEEVEKSEGQGEVLQERIRNLEHNKNRLLEALEGSLERQTATELEMSEVSAAYEQVIAKLEEIQQQLQAEQLRFSDVSHPKHDEEESLKGDLLEILNECAHLRNDIRYAEQQIISIQEQADKLKLNLKHKSDQIKQLEQTIADKKQKQRTIQTKLQRYEQNRNETINKLTQTKTALQDVESVMTKWQQQHGAFISRRDTMKEMQADFEGFFQGVKGVLRASKYGKINGICGAAAELMAVPRKIEFAIETALGSALQHVVCEDEESARSAIAHLKKQKLGRATFLPLTVIRPRPFNAHERSTIEQMNGFIGIGSELVQYDQRFANVMSYLLGHVLITETLEQANRIAAQCQYRYRVVTLEGDIVHAGGSMSGGSAQRKGSSLLGRKRQLEQLGQEITAASDKIKQLETTRAELLKEQTNLSKQLEENQAKSEQLRVEQHRVEAERGQWVREQQMAHDQLAAITQETALLDETLQEQIQTKALAESDLNKMQQQESGLRAAIEAAETFRKERESAKDQLQSEVTDLKVQMASVSQEKEALLDRLNRLRKEASMLKTEMGSHRDAIQQVEIEHKKAQEKKQDQAETLQALKLKRKQCSEKIEFTRAGRMQAIQDLDHKENETKDQRLRLQEAERKLHEIEVRVNRLDVELDNLLKSLGEDYEISFELAKQRYPLKHDIEITKQKVQTLKKSLADLGEVNLGAIEEFERISERYAFLTEQQSDLKQAKQNIYDVILEMDREMSQLFEETFTEIRAHFTNVFHQLFGGGRADLILTDPDDLLDTGIEIVAQPPGKKLQNLQLLSGGERALTAIALLFAILHVKPVPFCVLDEVEAALDEANVVRFARYLRQFSEETQFIVVTHRKGTMEEADVLYGVTMEDDGVSKLVSVKLDEATDMITA